MINFKQLIICKFKYKNKSLLCITKIFDSLQKYIKQKSQKSLNIKKNFNKLKIEKLDNDKKYIILKKLGKNKKDLFEKMLAIGKFQI